MKEGVLQTSQERDQRENSKENDSKARLSLVGLRDNNRIIAFAEK